ncbi:chemotaxis protein CheR [Neisseriaceae bacterium TC5R-5]|nr:chemotaxis protein CheR [Neisseriaceae bacterium TC5R-5]
MYSDEQATIKFTRTDFRRVCALIYQRVGISLNDSKIHMAYARLAKRVKLWGGSSFTEYLDFLESDAEAAEWQNFINALTTNLTFFFRESHHFEALQQHAQLHQTADHLYRVWSSATSTGEEAYSIAMTLLAVRSSSKTFCFELLASDIDTSVLQQASRGVYDFERTEAMSLQQVHRFFDKGVAANAGKVRLKQEVRDCISFFQLNLVASSWPSLGMFDVIFCRNVLIYFDKPTQAVLLSRMAQLLRQGGLLFLGHSENILHLSDAFTACGKTCYRLIGAR